MTKEVWLEKSWSEKIIRCIYKTQIQVRFSSSKICFICFNVSPLKKIFRLLSRLFDCVEKTAWLEIQD